MASSASPLPQWVLTLSISISLAASFRISGVEQLALFLFYCPNTEIISDSQVSELKALRQEFHRHTHIVGVVHVPVEVDVGAKLPTVRHYRNHQNDDNFFSLFLPFRCNGQN